MAKVGTFTAGGGALLSFLREQSKQAESKNCKSWCIREKVSKLEFIEGVQKLEQANDLWEKGRFFNTALEIRWQKHNEEYKAFVLTEGELPTLPEGLAYNENPEETPLSWEVKAGDEGDEIELWGEFKQECNGFVEVRIPHVLPYPVQAKAGDTAAISSIHYKLNGVIVFTRFTEVKNKDART